MTGFPVRAAAARRVMLALLLTGCRDVNSPAEQNLTWTIERIPITAETQSTVSASERIFWPRVFGTIVTPTSCEDIDVTASERTRSYTLTIAARGREPCSITGMAFRYDVRGQPVDESVDTLHVVHDFGSRRAQERFTFTRQP